MITNFLDLAVWIFEFLVMGLLPLVSVILAAIMIRKVGEAGRDTLYRFFAEGWATQSFTRCIPTTLSKPSNY